MFNVQRFISYPAPPRFGQCSTWGDPLRGSESELEVASQVRTYRNYCIDVQVTLSPGDLRDRHHASSGGSSALAGQGRCSNKSSKDTLRSCRWSYVGHSDNMYFWILRPRVTAWIVDPGPRQGIFLGNRGDLMACRVGLRHVVL
jgi:hypothetical protein